MFIEQSSYFRSLSHIHNDVSGEDNYAYLQSFRDCRVLERMPVFLQYMLKKSLKIPKGQSETVYRRTYNTIAKRKITRGQTTIELLLIDVVRSG